MSRRFNLSGACLCMSLLFWLSCKKEVKENKEEFSNEAKKALSHAETLIALGHHKASVRYLDSAYATFKPNRKDLIEKYNIAAYYCLVTENRPDRASVFADGIFRLLKGKENLYKYEYAIATFLKGDILMAKKRYDEAFKYYYDAQKFAVTHLGKCDSYGFTYKLGMLRYHQERYHEAIPYIKKAFADGANCKERNSSGGLSLNRESYLNSLALCYENMRQFNEALVYYQKVLSFIDSAKLGRSDRNNYWQRSRGIAYGNMGGVYLKLHYFKLAEKYLKLSIAINDRPGYEIVDAQTAKLKLVDLYLQLSDFEAADRLFKELQQAFDSQLSDASQLMFYQLKGRYADSLHRSGQAYAYLEKYYRMRDSLNEIDHGLKHADIDIAFSAREQEHKLLLLGKQNAVKRSYLIILVIFLTMAMLLLVMMWRNRKKLQGLNLEITRQNANLHRVLKALERSQEENTRMMKIVAHDLRSPIAATISITSILKTGSLAPADREMVELLETSSRHSLEMITNLLNVNTTGENLAKEPINMHKLLDYCVNMLRFKAREKEQELLLQTEEAEIHADGAKLWRVFSNLITNAIKFSRQGAVIEVILRKEGDFVLVAVKDHGIGMPVELRDKIFDIFTDAKRRGTEGEQSFGLGLAISKQIVEAHGGEIWLKSEVGKGSTFWVRLPFFS